MRVGRFRGLRSEILGNLAVVSLISLLLTGFGVWFINGKHMLQQHLLQGRLLVESLAEETLELLPADETGAILDDPARRTAVHDLMQSYRDKDSRMQLQLVGPDLRVLRVDLQRIAELGILNPAVELGKSDKRVAGITAAMPIRMRLPIVQPCSMTLWPMVTSSPMISGKPAGL